MKPGLKKQPTLAPTRKVAAVGIAGAGATVLLMGARWLEVPVSAEEAMAIVALVAAGAGYFTHERA